MSRVYLDHAATSPLRSEVLEAMLPWLTAGYGNANALYQEGKQARAALEEARATIAHHIGASPTEITFTSGGTESNNTLIKGITQTVRVKKGRERGGNHILCSAFEHHAVLEPVQTLKREGYEVGLIKPTREGFVTPETLAQVLRPDTVLTCVMTAQNEIGTVQPIAELARSAHANNSLFFTDAVQALGKISFAVDVLGVDAASFSAHKIGGPKGVGAFYLKRQTPFTAVQLGGGQEGNRRSGTQNIAGAVGFAKALELAEKERAQETTHLAQLRDSLATELLNLDSRIKLTVDPSHSEHPSLSFPRRRESSQALPSRSDDNQTLIPTVLPNILSFTVGGFESETLILKLDDAGFAVSGGSACSTGSLEPSHVLSALGISRDKAYNVLRVSLGHENTQADMEAFITALAAILRG